MDQIRNKLAAQVVSSIIGGAAFAALASVLPKTLVGWIVLGGVVVLGLASFYQRLHLPDWVKLVGLALVAAAAAVTVYSLLGGNDDSTSDEHMVVGVGTVKDAAARTPTDEGIVLYPNDAWFPVVFSAEVRNVGDPRKLRVTATIDRGSALSHAVIAHIVGSSAGEARSTGAATVRSGTQRPLEIGAPHNFVVMKANDEAPEGWTDAMRLGDTVTVTRRSGAFNVVIAPGASIGRHFEAGDTLRFSWEAAAYAGTHGPPVLVEARVRKPDSPIWETHDAVHPGDILEYQGRVENVSGRSLHDVVFRNSLPPAGHVTYLPGSARLGTLRAPTFGEQASDNVTNGGLSFKNMAPTAVLAVRLKVRVLVPDDPTESFTTSWGVDAENGRIQYYDTVTTDVDASP